MTTTAPLRRRVSIALGPIALGLLWATQAQAAPLQNADFSQGLQAWSTAGDVAVTAGPVLGLDLGATPSLTLGTASTWYDDDAPAPAGSYNLSGLDPLDLDPLVNLPATSLEADLGLPYGAFGPDAYEVSAAQQSFDLNAGDVVRFDWRLFTQQDSGPTPLPDTAWLLWSDAQGSQMITLADTVTLAAQGAMQDLGHGWLGSGMQSWQYTATQAGTVRLGWALADIGSYTGTSWLAVQGLGVTPSVPEPAGLALVLTGLVLLARSARRTHLA